MRGAAAAIQAPYKQTCRSFSSASNSANRKPAWRNRRATQQTQVGTQTAELQQQMLRKRLAMMAARNAQNVIANLGELSDD